MDNNIIPEIYFNHKSIKILRYIRWHRANTEYKIQKKFGENANSLFLVNLCKAGYLVAIRPDGRYTDFRDGTLKTASDFSYWVSPKGEKLLDDRFDRMWQWAIPTAISIVALAISVLSALFPGVIKVILLG